MSGASRLDSVRFAMRSATADLRPFPDFVIIGAQRSGTTSIYRWLAARPDVAPALKKEVHYFDNYFDRGPRWYRAHFAIGKKGRLTGESSPYMLYHPLAPQRAASVLPATTKFVVLLREPVQRAISNYWLRRQRGLDEPMEQSIELEPQRLAVENPRVLRGEVSHDHMIYSFMARGEYAPQLQRWFEAVGRDRILIVESERLYRDTAVADSVLEWLGLPPTGDPFPTSNEAPRLEEASPELVATLHRHFEPYNQALFELLGYELWSDQIPS